MAGLGSATWITGEVKIVTTTHAVAPSGPAVEQATVAIATPARETPPPVLMSAKYGALRLWVHWPQCGVAVIQASGALDAGEEPRFAEVMRNRFNTVIGTVILDLSEVTFLDTTGAVTLLEAARRAQVRGVGLRLVSSPAVDRLLGLMDVVNRFRYAASTEQALAEV